ncbi:peptidoglycan bridge formation glycyltransferase FemA/FemB family protein [Candidatus Parcubacteria bacterium]|nr:MAG: peptidoglycan bridge formation glycyltransferase FemA/FemB family protein [Candidatus Parcubacteria bacterium]
MDRITWNNEVKKNSPVFGAFLHSYEWGEFQRSLGREVKRIYHISNGKIDIMAQAIKMDLPMGQYYWYVPKGPIGGASLEKKLEFLKEELVGGIFVRIEPDKADRMLRVNDIQPSATLMLDLKKSEETLLADCKAKTRYNIRLAFKKGVEVKRVNIGRFSDFIRLMKQTANRDRFSAHPDIYYKTMLKTIVNDNGAKAFIAMAFYNKRPLAANIMIDFAGVRTYLHGASSNLHRNVMAPYALHWFLIQDAKKRGLEFFDFWGIAPPDADKKHPWYGITRYKKGFGGFIVQQPGTFDLPSKHLWYSAYRTVRTVRKWRLIR